MAAASSAMAAPVSVSSRSHSSCLSLIDPSLSSHHHLARISLSPVSRAIRRARLPLTIHASSAAVVAAPPASTSEKKSSRLRSVYFKNVVPAMKEEFKYSNTLQVPKLEKVVVNCGIGEASQNAKVLENAMKDIATVSGQRPIITRAKKAIAGFKIRKDVPVGVAVTLRGELMYSFLDRLLNLVLPRTRDFRGVNPYSLDGKGNFNLGLKEQGVFPEIKFDNIDKPRGMNISIFTSAKTDKEGQKLLSLLGMPFRAGDVSARPAVRKKKVKFFGKGSKARKAVVKKKKKKN